MALSVRYYIFPDGESPKRVSQRLVSGLVSGDECLPEYAGSRQRVLDVVLDNEEGAPTRICLTTGIYWDFDETGDIGEGLRKSIAAALENAAVRLISPKDKVVDLSVRRRSRRRDANQNEANENRWQASAEELDRIAADIWPKTKSHRLPVLKTAVPRLTYEGKHALEKATEGFWKVGFALDGLNERGLAGLAYRARLDGKADGDNPLYRAVAELAERKLEVLRRRRRGNGTWYAFVEIIRWDRVSRSGTTLATYHRKCDGRKAAVAASQELLKEHAGKMDHDITIEAGVETDLEWLESGRDSRDDL